MVSQTLNTGHGPALGELFFDAAKFHGQGNTEYPRLHIQGKINYFSPENPFTDFLIREASAQLHLENVGKIADSLIVPIRTLRRGHSVHPGNDWPSFEFPLDKARISVLERVRKGGDLPMRLSLQLSVEQYGVIQGDSTIKRPDLWGLHTVHRVAVDFNLRVPQSSWLDQVLPQIGYGRVHLVELPAVPISACEKLKLAFDALKQADSRHKDGLYDDAVAKCRVALEPLLEKIEKVDAKGNVSYVPILKKSWETRLGKATYDWLNDSFRAVKGAANPIHHSPIEHYDQFESQMIIAITTTLIAYAARHENA